MASVAGDCCGVRLACLRRARRGRTEVINRLFYGDNLDVLRESIETESVDLVYLDPPFNSNRSYNVLFKQRSGDEAQAQIEAFDDTWTWSHEAERQYQDLVSGGAPLKVADAIEAMRRLLGENDVLAYLVMMTPRVVELHRVLKQTGSLYLHCDPTASHYLKVMLDAVFGPAAFLNEVVWKRTAVKGDAARRFGRIHDVILAYAKTPGHHTFNAQQTAHDPEYAARFKKDDGDGRGPYRDGPLDSPNPRPNLTYEFRGHAPPKNGWRVSRDEMERLAAEDRLIYPKRPGGRIARKLYLRDQEGVSVGDVWTDIAPLNSQAAERLGYPTQKPLALVERILRTSTNAGDVVLDPFCGCGTTVDAAEKLGRKWVGIDITYLAVDLITKRLRDTHGDEVMENVEVRGIPRDVSGARALFQRSPFDFERWAVSLVNGQPNLKQVGDKGVDGVIRFPLDGTGKNIGKVLVSVKGGKAPGPTAMRDLAGTVEAQRAQMGVLVTLAEPTRGMLDAARHAGVYTWEWNGQAYPKVQIVTVEELLAGARLEMPPPLMPYVRAKRQLRLAAEQEGLFDVG
jgi:DNA modification methylase